MLFSVKILISPCIWPKNSVGSFDVDKKLDELYAHGAHLTKTKAVTTKLICPILHIFRFVA